MKTSIRISVILELVMLFGVGKAEQSEKSSDCEFPIDWHSRMYFDYKHDHVHAVVNESGIFGEGEIWGGVKCKMMSTTEKDLYIFGNEECSKCIQVVSPHTNVLKVRATHCDTHHDYDFSNDAMIKQFCTDNEIIKENFDYIFKYDFKPIDCPFRKVPFSFVYGSGDQSVYGVCKNPSYKSDVQSCTKESQLVFQYSSCPESSLESKKEQITCLGHWNDGDVNYLVAKVEIQRELWRPTGVPGNFRCFAYEEIRDESEKNNGRRSPPNGYAIGISAQATCTGLTSISNGETLLNLTMDNSTTCNFPHWFTSSTWHSIDYRTAIRPSRTATEVSVHTSVSLTPFKHDSEENYVYKTTWPLSGKLTCWKSNSTTTAGPVHDHNQILVVKEVIGCKTRALCVKLSKTSDFISKITIVRQDDTTSQADFIFNCLKNGPLAIPSAQGPMVEMEVFELALIADGFKTEKCPLNPGLYQVGDLSIEKITTNEEEPCKSFMFQLPSNISTGCSDRDHQFKFVEECNVEYEKPECLGSWISSNNETYYIAKFPNPINSQDQQENDHPKISCFHYNSNDNETIRMEASMKNCPHFRLREPSENHQRNEKESWTFSLKTIGPCPPGSFSENLQGGGFSIMNTRGQTMTTVFIMITVFAVFKTFFDQF